MNQTAEYALRAMARLAALPEETPGRAADLAVEVRIPRAYLSKILRQLVVAGLLHARKGHGGGFVLARPPSRISFRDVLEALGPPPERPPCAFGWDACDAHHPCPLHPAWTRLKEALDRWAATTTLAEVAAGTHALTPHRRRPPSRRG